MRTLATFAITAVGALAFGVGFHYGSLTLILIGLFFIFIAAWREANLPD